MQVSPECHHLLQVTLRPREMESLSDFLLIPMGLDMGSQSVLQDGKFCSRDLLHPGYLGCLGFFFGMMLSFTGYSEQTQEPGSGFSVINMMNKNPEAGLTMLETCLA